MQPVPWVRTVSMRSAESCTTSPSSVSRMSSASAVSRRWPPLMTTFFTPMDWIFFAAVRRSSAVWMVMPQMTSASGTFGVSTVASGRISRTRVAEASSSMSAAPPLAIITGSTTTGISGCFRSSAATARMISASGSMPVLRAPISKSLKTECICSFTNSTGTLWMPCTPRVFCAVTATMTEVPKTRRSWKVFRSA